MSAFRNLSKPWRILALVAILAGLYVASRLVPFPGSWPVHFLFTFTLTLLVYKNLLNSSHTGAFLCAMILLMALWEVYEWVVGMRVRGSMFLASLDIAMDLVAGLLGTILAIRRSQPPSVE